MLQNLGIELENVAVRAAELRAAQTVVAIERYRLAHGSALPVD
jgi:hypothetical protein